MLLQLGCVAYVSRALWEDRAEFGRALNMSASTLALLLLLMLAAHVQRTFEFTYMLRRLGVREPFGDAFLLTAAGYLLNHLPLNAGFVMRAALLKRDHALSYTSYLSLTMVNALINVAVGAFIGLLTTARALLGGQAHFLQFSVFLAVVLGAAVLLALPESLAPAGSSFVARRLRTFLEGAKSIRGNGRGLTLLAGLAALRILGNALRLWLCFAAMGASISIMGAALLGWGSVLFTLINVTPGNLGLRELVLSLAAAELGSTQSLGMAAASIDRVVLLAYVVALGVPSLFSLKRRSPPPRTRDL